jgi:ribose/xylose/arabinose/galactoside ABC-type transport system permease subunit
LPAFNRTNYLGIEMNWIDFAIGATLLLVVTADRLGRKTTG